MSLHLLRDLEHLQRNILDQGSLVEAATERAIVALVDRRLELCEAVEAGDSLIDAKEIEIEEACLQLLALHQPVAADLRYVLAILKVNNDLERMGDLAVNIAGRVAYLVRHEPLALPAQLTGMAQRVRTMVSDCLKALVDSNTALAQRILAEDDAVDTANRELHLLLGELMEREPATIERAVHALSISKNLERIADHATNVAEYVLFMVEGRIVRHGFNRRRARAGARAPASR